MSTYRTLKGYNIKSVTSDPSNTKEGQIWYNDTSNKIRVNTVKPAVFASGGNLNEAKQQLTGCGTQTANLAFGGEAPGGTTANSEEYNGSAWTEGNNLGTSRYGVQGCGPQTAALAVGGVINFITTGSYENSISTTIGSNNTKGITLKPICLG